MQLHKEECPRCGNQMTGVHMQTIPGTDPALSVWICGRCHRHIKAGAPVGLEPPMGAGGTDPSKISQAFETSEARAMAEAINGGDWDTDYTEAQKRGWILKVRWAMRMYSADGDKAMTARQTLQDIQEFARKSAVARAYEAAKDDARANGIGWLVMKRDGSIHRVAADDLDEWVARHAQP